MTRLTDTRGRSSASSIILQQNETNLSEGPEILGVAPSRNSNYSSFQTDEEYISWTGMKGEITAEFKCKRNSFPQQCVSELMNQFIISKSLINFSIDQRLDQAYGEALIQLMKTRKMVKYMRFINDGNTGVMEIQNSNQDQPLQYVIRQVNGQDVFMLPSEYLQEELKEWLDKESIASAINIENNKLTLFVWKDQRSLETDLDKKTKTMDNIFRNAYHVLPIKTRIALIEEANTGKCSPGGQLVYHDENHEERKATCGAFVKDEEGKVYALSSSHRHKPDEFYILQPTLHPQRVEVDCVGHKYQKSPLTDAVLLDLNNGVSQESAYLYEQGFALCGPYTGKIEDLPDCTGPQDEKTPGVMKCGSVTNVTQGRLKYFKFKDPQCEITDALVITPKDPDVAFSEEGDCGSVVFLEREHEHSTTEEADQTSETYHSFHEGLGIVCSGATMQFPNGEEVKWSLACRLDLAIEVLGKEVGKELSLLPVGHTQA